MPHIREKNARYLILQGSDMPMVRAVSDSQVVTQPTLTYITAMPAIDPLPFG